MNQIHSRFFYGHLISDFLNAKAGVLFAVFDEGVTRSGFVAGVEGLEPYGYEIGPRLCYEIAKEFAPHVGMNFEQFAGNTAGFVAVSGEPTSLVRALVGLKFWF